MNMENAIILLNVFMIAVAVIALVLAIRAKAAESESHPKDGSLHPSA